MNIYKSSRLTIFIVLIVLFLSACNSQAKIPSTAVPTSAPPTATPTPVPPSTTPEPPDQIIFYGNSLTYYNLGVSKHLKLMAAAADPPLSIEVQENTIPDSTLKDHLGRDGTTAIQEGTWDIVVLQEYLRSASSQEFLESVRIFDKASKDIGAQTVLYMHWELMNPDLPPRIDEIAQAHRQIASELGIKVAPVGLAWQRSIQERPELQLYDYDGIHPTVAGTYLAVCVLYATIFDQSPVGIDYQPFDMVVGNKAMEIGYKDWQLAEDDVAFMQQMAWETVTDYLAQNE